MTQNINTASGAADLRTTFSEILVDLPNTEPYTLFKAGFDAALAAGQATAAQGVVYAELPAPNYPKSGGFPGTFAEAQMRAFADATCALRASHGQAPAGAGMGHTDGGRNMFYEGRFDGESQREQQARLRWANDMRAAFERHTGNGWFDKDWRTETGLWSSAWHACLAAQPTTTAQADSVQEDAARWNAWASGMVEACNSDEQEPAFLVALGKAIGDTEPPITLELLNEWTDAARKEGEKQ